MTKKTESIKKQLKTLGQTIRRKTAKKIYGPVRNLHVYEEAMKEVHKEKISRGQGGRTQRNLSKEKGPKKTKRTSQFPWLHSPHNSLPWEVDPIYLERLSDTVWCEIFINRIMDEVTKVPWKVVKKDQAEKYLKNRKKEHRNLDLNNYFEEDSIFRRSMFKDVPSADSMRADRIRQFLEEPNPQDSYHDTVSQLGRQALRVGNAVMFKYFDKSDYEDGELLQDPTLRELKVTDATSMTKEFTDTGYIRRFWQFDMSAKQRRNQGFQKYPEPQKFDPREVVWMDWTKEPGRAYGISPVEKAEDNLRELNLAQEQGMLYFRNGALPPGVMNLDKDDWTEDEAESWTQSWVDDVKGSHHKIPWARGEVNFEKFSYNYKELQFMKRMKFNARVLASLYKVPLSVLEMEEKEVNRSTQAQKYAQFQDGAVSYFLKYLERIWNNQVVPHLSDDFMVLYEPGLSEERMKLISDRVTNEYNSGVVWRSKAQKQLGYEDPPEDATYSTDFQEEQGNNSGPGPGIEEILTDRDQTNTDNLQYNKQESLHSENWHDFSFQTSDVKDIQEEIKPVLEDTMEEIMNDNKLMESINENLEEPETKTQKQKSLNDINLRITQILESSEIVDKVQERLKETTNQKAEEVVDRSIEEGEEELEDIDVDRVKDRIRERDMNFADDFTEEVKTSIRNKVETGWEEGWSLDKMQDELNEKVDDFSENRSRLWARDQLQRASGEARNEVARELEKVEIWISTSDNRTRKPHVEMDGSWKKPQEDFEVDYSLGDMNGPSSVQESFPGDSKWGIQCRCDTMLVDREEVDMSDHAGVI